MKWRYQIAQNLYYLTIDYMIKVGFWVTFLLFERFQYFKFYLLSETLFVSCHFESVCPWFTCSVVIHILADE